MFTTLTLSLAAPMSAQIRADLRVQARVLPASQSREALDAGWRTIADGGAMSRSSLATVRVSPQPAAPGDTAARSHRRPTVLSIDFLRN